MGDRYRDPAPTWVYCERCLAEEKTQLVPLNAPLYLEDGRLVLIRKAVGLKHMECRQKAAPDNANKPLLVGEKVVGVAGPDKKRTLLEVVKRTKRNVTLKVLGDLPDDMDG
jgi:hypothetical protein